MLVCSDCFKDSEIQGEINSNETFKGICEICGETKEVIDLNYFNDFFTALIGAFKLNDKSNKTLLEYFVKDFNIFENKEIASKVLNSIIESNKLPISIKSGVAYTDEILSDLNVWEDIKKQVRYKTRFFTNMDKLEQKKFLEPTDNILTQGMILFRARITPSEKSILGKEEMGCPLPEKATPGRANPIGIPYLYLSDSPKTTYFEVRAVFLDNLSIGKFRITRNLKIVDFTENISLYKGYIDDPDNLSYLIAKTKILKSISADLSSPLRRYDSEIEYVPTQYICEYCKYVLHADGIIFRSALYSNGLNYVLFDKNDAECIDVELHEIKKIDIDIEHLI